MRITSVKTKKLNDAANTRLIGVASAVIDNVFIVKDIKIIRGDDHLFISMPSQKMPDGSYSDVAHPLNKDCRKLFEDAILKEYYSEGVENEEVEN
jgi:stage V sporulation protein G